MKLGSSKDGLLCLTFDSLAARCVGKNSDIENIPRSYSDMRQKYVRLLEDRLRNEYKCEGA